MGDPLPNSIKNLVGLSFVLGIKVTDYNWKEGSQLYTIEQLYNLDRNPHTIDQLDRITMVRIIVMASDNSWCLILSTHFYCIPGYTS